jgi:uncharacterized protein (TIGR03435 family)
MMATITVATFLQTSGSVRPSFAVAAIKPNTSRNSRVAIQAQPGGRFVASNATLQMLITTAFEVQSFRIFGGPNWVNSDRFDIEARTESGNAITGPPFPVLQSLL